MFPYKKPSFSQGFSDDATLQKILEIRRFLTLNFIFLTANIPSQYVLYVGTYPRVARAKDESRLP